MGCKNNKNFKQLKKLYVNTNVVFHKHFNREEKKIFKLDVKTINRYCESTNHKWKQET